MSSNTTLPSRSINKAQLTIVFVNIALCIMCTILLLYTSSSYPDEKLINKYKQYADRPISQSVFILLIAINRAKHVYATVIIKHNYMLMCNHKIVINIMLCLLNSTGHI